jgi:L-ascorbate metabolism protein UlaG (beta-lactamase superfamily)
MKLRWFGHSCFLLTADDGIKLLMDPYNEMVGKLPAIEADIVTVSHQHGDHNNVKAVQGQPVIMDKPGTFYGNGIEISGVETAHDEAGGSKRGKSIIFSVTMDGIRFCHCGDLGHLLTPEQLKAIGKADVLLIPVGRFFTIDAETAAQVVGQIKPAVTIPMHYNTGNVNLPIKDAEPFIKAMGGKAHRISGREIELKQSDLPKYTGVVVFGSA